MVIQDLHGLIRRDVRGDGKLNPDPAGRLISWAPNAERSGCANGQQRHAGGRASVFIRPHDVLDTGPRNSAGELFKRGLVECAGVAAKEIVEGIRCRQACALGPFCRVEVVTGHESPQRFAPADGLCQQVSFDHIWHSTENCDYMRGMKNSRIQKLLDDLQAAARAQQLSKRALAEQAKLHPNTLRHFCGHRCTYGGAKAWLPSVRVIARLEPILLSGANKRPRQPRVTTSQKALASPTPSPPT